MQFTSAYHLIIFVAVASMFCHEKTPQFHLIPAPYVYTITEHNDSIYFSTQTGNVFRFDPDNPDSIVRVAKKTNYPIRGLAFKKDGTLYASSYQSGIHRLVVDSFVADPKMWRTGWAMKLDAYENVWLAGLQGVFRQKGDTLVKFADLHEAYDVDFYHGKLAVAHRRGITLYDTSTAQPIKTFERNTVCWTIDIFDDSLVTGGYIGACGLIDNRGERYVTLRHDGDVPWSIVRNADGDLVLGTQKGLFRIKRGGTKMECIGFRGKCIKSLFVDHHGRLWVGRYFGPMARPK